MNLEAVKPLGSKLLVALLPLYSSDARVGGVSLTLVDGKRHWDHKTRKAKVLGVGPRVKEIRTGDEVLFTGAAGRWVDDPVAECAQDTTQYRSVEENEVLAILEKESV
jgi:hypothetical protein